MKRVVFVVKICVLGRTVTFLVVVGIHVLSCLRFVILLKIQIVFVLVFYVFVFRLMMKMVYAVKVEFVGFNAFLGRAV